MVGVSVSEVVDFYRCRACFLERLKNGGRGKQTLRSILGEMLHELAGRCLRSEVETIEELYIHGGLDLKSLQKRYRRVAGDTSRSILWKYGGRLVQLGGSLEDAENLLVKASRNVVEQRVLELFRELRGIGFHQLLSNLNQRSFNKRLYSEALRVYGSPDMLEVGRVVEFKYSKPGPRGKVREDIVLQLSLYSMLSEEGNVRVIYLPSFIYEDFQVNNIMIEWALRIIDELYSFLSDIPEKVEHTCIYKPKLMSIGGELLWAGFTYSHQ
jgi:hypothetical protein